MDDRGLADPPDERRHLTILFSDLVGSTELASRLDAEDVHEVLTAYQHKVAEVVAEHGGVISQFQGDGAVAYFGYPEAVESAGRDAVSAGLDVITQIGRLGSDLASELGAGALQARVGIHTGEVVVAVIQAGGAARIADVFGEVPNLAARLQGAGQPGDLIISDTTAALVSGYFVMEGLGSLELKGIARPVPAFRVLRRSAARRRLETGPLTRFVARSSESAWLEAQWSSVREGPARVVLVTGEPGIGKSRLLQEFASSLTDSGVPVAPIYCGRRDSLSPLRPFGPLMGGVPRTPDMAADWVVAQAASRPALLLVEDAHWADPSTMEAVDQVSRSAHRVLTVLTARPEYEDHPSLQPTRRLALERMGAVEALAIVSRVPGGDTLSEDIRRALVERADGVPLFLEELARASLQGQSGPGSEGPIPATLTEVITARLDRLGGARHVAQLASIVGRAFEPEVLQEVAALDRLDLDIHLQHLVEQAIVEPSGDADGRLWFRHALIHEAAYRSVLRAARRQAHSRVADTLVHMGRGDSQPEVVAFHLGAAGRAVEAEDHWRLAARAARQNARFREAAGHERELIALLPELPESRRASVELGARSRLTLCLTAVDQSSPEALVEGTRAQELARQAGDQLALLRNLLVLLPWWQANADYGSVDAALPEARQLAQDLGDVWAQETVARYSGAVRVWQGRAGEGVEQLEASFANVGQPLEASLSDVAPVGLPAADIVMASSRIATALGCWLTGRVDDAHRMREDTRRFAAGRSVPQAQAVTAATGAIIAQLDGDRDLVASLIAESVQMGDEVTRQWQQWSAVLQWWAGRSSVEPEIPGPLLRPYFLMLLVDNEDVPASRSLPLLEEALLTARATGEQFCEPEILRVRASVLQRVGDHEGAVAALEEATQVAVAQGASMLELRARTDRAQLPGADSQARADLKTCVSALAHQDQSRSVQRALAAVRAP
jgi:class 3 adenylate cyclase